MAAGGTLIYVGERSQVTHGGPPKRQADIAFGRSGGQNRRMAAKKLDRRLAAAAVAAVALYVGLAYGLAPFFWRHFERQPRLASFEATTLTALGLPGDAINVGLEGSEDDALCAMHAAG